jgi:hypothetical protein
MSDTTHLDEQFQSLLATVDRLRRERFPQLDAELVREILRAHAGGEADLDVLRDVEKVVEEYNKVNDAKD